MQASVLIAGAGYVGGALAKELLDAGSEVHVLRRRAEHPPGSKLFQADLLKPETLQGLPRCTHLVYAAAADGGSEEAYRGIYRDGLMHLLTALKKQGQNPRIIYTSSTSVYAEREGAWVSEEGAALTKDGSSRFMVEGERLLIEGGWSGGIVRFGGIYGPGRTYFVRRVKEGQEVILEGSQQFTNRIHRDDCVGIIKHLLSPVQTREGMQIFNGVDSESADRNEVIMWLAEQLGLNPHDIPRTEDTARVQHRGNKRVSNAKILAHAYSFRYPSYREGYATLLGEFGA